MKIRLGFVTNSSSTAYMILNKTLEPKTAIDFVKENADLIDDFNDSYNVDDDTNTHNLWGKKVTKKQLLDSAKDHKLLVFAPKPNDSDDYEYIAVRVDELARAGTLFATFAKWVAYNYDTKMHKKEESKSFTWKEMHVDG